MEIVNWVDPTWLDAWMVMFVRWMEDRGVPDMIPVDEWNDRPIGRDPDIMENDRSSPSQVGLMKFTNVSSVMKMVWL